MEHYKKSIIEKALVKRGWTRWDGNVWMKNGKKATFEYAIIEELENLDGNNMQHIGYDDGHYVSSCKCEMCTALRDESGS